MRFLNSNKAILFVIILVAFVLRFYNLFEIPLTHDEFSALRRTHFSTFSDLITQGVQVDGHPAGVQVFMFAWVKLFGYTAWVVKLPFLLMGVASVYLLFKVSKLWYNETVGLISASFLASMQIAVMYSQFARPYISGMFVILLMVLYLFKLIQAHEKRFWRYGLAYIFFAVCAAYNHYFSLLLALIIASSAIFLLPKNMRVKYLILCGIGVLLFLPHINVTLYQLGVGGIGGWLGKPSNTFLFSFIKYTFNFSTLVYLVTLLLIIVSWLKFKNEKYTIKTQLVFFAWFFLPFIIGYYYSRNVNPVLQFSGLIFGFPFLYFVLFGHVKELSVKLNSVIVLIILVVGIFSLVHTRRHYTLTYNSIYKMVAVDASRAIDEHANTLCIVNSHQRNTRLVIEARNLDSAFVWYNDFNNKQEFISFLQKQQAQYNYLYFGTNADVNPSVIPIIREYFPKLEWQNNYLEGTTFLFSKEPNTVEYFRELTFDSPRDTLWNNILLENYCSISENNYAYKLNKTIEWGPGTSFPLSELIHSKYNFVDISLKVLASNACKGASISTSIDFEGENLYWSSTPFSDYIPTTVDSSKWVTIHHSIKIADIGIKKARAKLKVFIWNTSNSEFIIDDFTIQERIGNPVVYARFNNIM